MFALFLEDLELFLQNSVNCRLNIFEICIVILLFADDMVIIGNSQEDLQQKFNSLFEYCNLWGLEVNTAKTKIVVFRNRGPILPHERWFYNNEA
jgi:hypothetical protein